MLTSFLLSLREGIEAALIIGIVLAALRKMKRDELIPAVWQGAACAAAASILAAIALNLAGAKLEGRVEEIFEGVAMLTAALLLTWMIVWMRQQAAGMQVKLEGEVSQAARQKGGRLALFGLAFLALGREGLELVLFLSATQLTSDGAQTLAGAALGLASAAVLGWLLFTSTRKLNLRQFFRVTNLILVLFAAGLLAHGVHEFNEAGLIPPLVEHIWNLNPILDEKSTLGLLLTALFGYNANPSLSEALAYVAYLGGVWLLWNRAPGLPRPTLARQPGD